MAGSEYRLKVESPTDDAALGGKSGRQSEDSVPILDGETQERQSIPTSVEYFELEDTWGGILLTPQLDVNGIKDKIVYIEGFLQSQAKDQGLEITKKTFNNVLMEMEKSVKSSVFHEKHERVDRVYKIMKLMEKTKTSRERVRNLIMKANEAAKRKVPFS